MADYHEYDSIAEGIKIDDITSNEENAELLRRLKANCPELDSLSVSGYPVFRYEVAHYNPGVRDFGWLGYFIGKNTSVTRMYFVMQNAGDGSGLEGLCENDEAVVDIFCRGVNRNKSIQRIDFHYLLGGRVFQQLGPFFRNNTNLTEIELKYSNLGVEGTHLLSQALGGCSKSLKKFSCSFHGQERLGFGEGLVDVILAMGVHPQLEHFGLTDTYSFGNSECQALATLLQKIQLCSLHLRRNAIDDEGVELLSQGLTDNKHLRVLSFPDNAISDDGVDSLTGALANCNLQELYLAGNDSISTEGLKTLLSTTCNLEEISMGSDYVDYEWEDIFPSLASNCKMEKLLICSDFEILPEDWAALSKVLCDTSTINSTYLSNHTLQSLVVEVPENDGVENLLSINEEYADKKQVAMMKILYYHPHLDMQPLFEWDFKALPRVVNWFALVSDCPEVDEEDIKSRKLSSIYEFIRAMPLLYIEEQKREKSRQE